MHYSDKDALLEECVIRVLSKLTEKIHSSLATPWGPNDPKAPQLLFEFAGENEKFIKIMLVDPCGSVFFQRSQKIILELLYQELKDEIMASHTPPGIPLELLRTFYAGAILALIEWWVDNEKPYSLAQMVEMISQAMEKSIRLSFSP